ncbi:Ecdysteroid-regulated 16 kDa protein precursor, putative [Pediculus humanus corporis]|uniref:Ecdysteroid-regulated 16 kDa protein, putative n=1 Tax=Pediculus humanus subsp. corporis TaxID=121224 RepID=E0VBV8_PEDHC|nr:Ecdysteroid-regulated 16 kDa protein precursor, putative [Pediculus humanus corporis]EEB10864.1 Ecdysteroid-regulated 16 kDa protein precursor, putative [Pediculus humanus corporis]
MEVKSVLSVIAIFLFLIIGFGNAEECLRGPALKQNNRVTLSNCEKPPCILKKKTTTTVDLKFTPKQDVNKMTNSVHALILGVPFPFIGVDGENVCDKIYDAKSGDKTSCPLKAGNEYLYKDQFKILDVYPKINVNVHWALKNEKDQDVLCFEVPAKIVR